MHPSPAPAVRLAAPPSRRPSAPAQAPTTTRPTAPPSHGPSRTSTDPVAASAATHPTGAALAPAAPASSGAALASRPPSTPDTVSQSSRVPLSATLLAADPSRRPSAKDLAAAASVPPTDPGAAPFVEECAADLLAPAVVADGVVSPREFADVLSRGCAREERCAAGAALAFAELPVALQLEFVMAGCTPEARCRDGPATAGRNGDGLGVDVGPGLEGRLRNLCRRSYGHVLAMGPAGTPGERCAAFALSRPRSGRGPGKSSSAWQLPLNHAVSFLHTAPMGWLAPPTPANVEDSGPSLKPFPSGQPPIAAQPPSLGDGPMSRGLVIGISITLVCLFLAACALHHVRKDHVRKASRILDTCPSRDVHRFGAVPQEPWARSLPEPCPGLSLSLGSSVASFRDHRFVRVYGPEGALVPQFDPDTAGAVVIGTVTVGTAYSSHGSDEATRSTGSRSAGRRSAAGSRSFVLRGRHLGSPASRSFFSRGRHLGSPAAPRDDVSSLSSHRSASLMVPKDGAIRRPRRVPSAARAQPGASRPAASPATVPARRRASARRGASVGDRRAASYVTGTALAGGGETRAAAVVARRNQFSFDASLPSESAASSAATPVGSCRSWPNIPHRVLATTPILCKIDVERCCVFCLRTIFLSLTISACLCAAFE